MTPLVSIIVPVHNAAHLLEKTMGNIILQSLGTKQPGAVEVILIDDASTDSSPALLMSLKQQFPTVVNLKLLEKNGGVGAARNEGLDLAKGEYVCFIDCDDMIDHTFCEKLYAVSDGADIVECYYYDEENKGFVTTVPKECRGVMLDDELHCLLLAQGGYVWGKLIKRSFLREHNMRFREEHLFEDVDFSALLYARAEKINFVEEPLFIYKETEGGATDKLNKQIYFDKIIEGVYAMDNALKPLPNYKAIRPGAEVIYTLFLQRAMSNVYMARDTGALTKEMDRQLMRHVKTAYRELIKTPLTENPYMKYQALSKDRLKDLRRAIEKG